MAACSGFVACQRHVGTAPGGREYCHPDSQTDQPPQNWGRDFLITSAVFRRVNIKGDYHVGRRLSGRATTSHGRTPNFTSETLADRHKVIERQGNPEICLELRCPLHECPAHLFLSFWR
jgi:hypothetical protein